MNMKKTRTTIIISSHDLNHVTDVSTRILLMEKGIIIKDMQGGIRYFAGIGRIFSGINKYNFTISNELIMMFPIMRVKHWSVGHRP